MTAPRVERLARHHYLFTSTWIVPLERSVAIELLADLSAYPRWWPEFLHARKVGDARLDMALRSRLPFTLTFNLTRQVEDRDEGRLLATAEGDIKGTVQWTVPRQGGTTTKAYFRQEVELQHRLVRPVDVLLRPLLEWNHAAAMESGQRGIVEYAHASE